MFATTAAAAAAARVAAVAEAEERTDSTDINRDESIFGNINVAERFQAMATKALGFVLGQLDHGYYLLRLAANGSTKPLFFSRGWGDVDSVKAHMNRLLKRLSTGDRFLDTPSPIDLLEWVPYVGNYLGSATAAASSSQVQVFEATFISPVAPLLPAESIIARFLFIAPAHTSYTDFVTSHRSNTRNPHSIKRTPPAIVLNLPGTGETDYAGRFGWRFHLATQLATERGWCTLLYLPAFHGPRAPAREHSNGDYHALDTVADYLTQCLSVYAEGAAILEWAHRMWPESSLCVNGFSWGAAMSAGVALVASSLVPKTTPLSVAACVGSSTPLVMVDSILEDDIDWGALVSDEYFAEAMASVASSRSPAPSLMSPISGTGTVESLRSPISATTPTSPHSPLPPSSAGRRASRPPPILTSTTSSYADRAAADAEAARRRAMAHLSQPSLLSLSTGFRYSSPLPPPETPTTPDLEAAAEAEIAAVRALLLSTLSCTHLSSFVEALKRRDEEMSFKKMGAAAAQRLNARASMMNLRTSGGLSGHESGSVDGIGKGRRRRHSSSFSGGKSSGRRASAGPGIPISPNSPSSPSVDDPANKRGNGRYLDASVCLGMLEDQFVKRENADELHRLLREVTLPMRSPRKEENGSTASKDHAGVSPGIGSGDMTGHGKDGKVGTLTPSSELRCEGKAKVSKKEAHEVVWAPGGHFTAYMRWRTLFAPAVTRAIDLGDGKVGEEEEALSRLFDKVEVEDSSKADRVERGTQGVSSSDGNVGVSTTSATSLVQTATSARDSISKRWSAFVASLTVSTPTSATSVDSVPSNHQQQEEEEEKRRLEKLMQLQDRSNVVETPLGIFERSIEITSAPPTPLPPSAQSPAINSADVSDARVPPSLNYVHYADDGKDHQAKNGGEGSTDGSQHFSLSSSKSTALEPISEASSPSSITPPWQSLETMATLPTPPLSPSLRAQTAVLEATTGDGDRSAAENS
ncbi:hypothetical protein HK102_003702 [Quaeritorhiza haematococci]|nr:hypothetical protein HK102_003702 [Quaeritorhiza haematococci]